MRTPAELKETIQRFETMVARHRRTIAELSTRRGELSDQVMVEIDERIDVNQRIIDALNRALDVMRRDLERGESGRPIPEALGSGPRTTENGLLTTDNGPLTTDHGHETDRVAAS